MCKTNICFVGNFYLTKLYDVLAGRLLDHDVDSFWIIPKKSQYDELCNRYPKEKLLLLNRSWIEKDNEPIGDFKLNELLFSDRVWKYSKTEGYRFLTNIQKPIYDFIKKNNIKLVFGEVTWAHEILIHRMCTQIRSMDCSYFSQMVARIPNNRFFFFSDEKLSQIIKVQNKIITSLPEIKIEKPAYLSINNKLMKKKMSLKGILHRLKLFISNENIEFTDPNVITNRIQRLKIVGKEIINQQFYQFLHRTTLEEIETKKFVFYGFHVQPEASVDVCGRYNENQFEIALNIWRQLPPGWLLVLKEHSNAIGNRSVSFFKKLLRYPNIVLINEYTDSHQIIKKAQLVVVNTGTLGLEAALMGIPAISLSKVYFNILNYCRYMTWQDIEKYDTLEDVITEINSKGNNLNDLSKLLQKHSFEGTVCDVHSMPSVLEEGNISNIVSAFLALISWETSDCNR